VQTDADMQHIELIRRQLSQESIGDVDRKYGK